MAKDNQDILSKIQIQLNAFNNGSLKENSINFLNTLGYKSDRILDLNKNGINEFIEKESIRFNYDKAKFDEWDESDFIFQLTDTEIDFRNNSMFDENTPDFTIKSYVFYVIKLSKDSYSRTELANIIREVNKIAKQPIFVIFKYGNKISLAIINRRANKNDSSKDVLEKVSLIKDINIENPHRGHIDIISSFDLKQMKKINSFDDLHKKWEEILDTKLLNKQFYKEIANWYFWAMENVEFPTNSNDCNEIDKLKSTNLIRLLTRFIFVWFIKEKGLVPNKIFEESELKNILKELDLNENSFNYYQAILQNLFFATLNQKISDRKFAKNDGYLNNKKEYGIKTFFRYEDLFEISQEEVVKLFETVPFLNGGLFDCLDNTETKDIIDGFSRTDKNRAKVPNILFFGGELKVDLSKYYNPKKKDNDKTEPKPRIETVRGLINILNNYKFTISENTPLEQDIALDPELLGTVFENLLAIYNPETKESARKATGSFYTPREIVNYMVDESIIAYLENKINEYFNKIGVHTQTGMSEQPNSPQTEMSELPNTSNEKVEQTFVSVNQNSPIEKVEQTFVSVNNQIKNNTLINSQLNITKRNLPHWQYDGSYYFITFRTLNKRILSENEKKFVYEHILDGNSKFYHLVTFVIMPDHVHLIIKPNTEYDLSRIMKGIKGVSSHKINELNKTEGANWQAESFDRIIRNISELNEKAIYIANNPIKKNLSDSYQNYKWYYLNNDYDFYLFDDKLNTQTEMSELPQISEQPNLPQTEMSELPSNNKVEQTFLSVQGKLRHLISYSEENHKFNDVETLVLIEAIDQAKILDPACGSGAFPMGILHKLTHLLHKLDPQNMVWRQKLIYRVPANLQSEFEESIKDKSLDYIRKLGLIENCIFGVDIQAIAIQISKLRFFISLIVEQEKEDKENFGIKPLPNLETKFVAANTLIGLEKPKIENRINFQSEEVTKLEKKLKDIREAIFYADSYQKKKRLINDEKETRLSLKIALEKDDYSTKTAEQIASWDPFNQNASSGWFDPEFMFGLNDGFDIVIGNPPYLNVEKIDKIIKDNILNFKTAYQKFDLYVLFYEKALELLETEGILNFITSNKFLSQGYGLLLRQLFIKYTIQQIINFNYDIFESATVRTCIFQLKKKKEDANNIKIIDINSKLDKEKFDTLNFKMLQQCVFEKTEENNFRINLNSNKILILNKIQMNTLKVKEICSVNYGLRPSSEKLNLKKEAFIYGSNPNNKFKPYFEGKDMGYWLVERLSFIDYKPEVMYNPMFTELFDNEKLVGLRTLSDIGKLRFIYDNKGYYCNDSVVVLTLWHKFRLVEYQTIKRTITNQKIEISKLFSYKYLQAILNSKLIKFFVNELMYDGTHFYPNHMKAIPIKNIFPEIQKPFIKLVDQILEGKKEGRDTTAYEMEIDQLVYMLYELSKEEIKIVEGR